MSLKGKILFSVISTFLLLVNECTADNFATSSYFCSELNLQQHIDIGQLLGMWFVVEKIVHSDDLRYVKNLSTCPIIYITEDHSRSTTYNPMNKNYDIKYGGDYGYNRENQRRNNPYDPYNNQNYDRGWQNTQQGQEYYTEKPYNNYDNRQYTQPSYYNRQGNPLRGGQNTQQGQEYTQTPYNNYDNRQYTQTPYYNRQVNPRRYGSASHEEYIRHLHSMRYLSLRWDGDGDTTEYNLKYNISRPGLWISSGPDDGTHLKTEFQHFAGTVQVLKAVGNHLVLTFCHPHPNKQLFTVLLSREAKINPADRHSVHNMLATRGLTTTTVQRMCSSCGKIDANAALVAVFSVVYLMIVKKIGIYT